MERELFDELVESLKEPVEISSGQLEPSRRFQLYPSNEKSVGEELDREQIEDPHL